MRSALSVFWIANRVFSVRGLVGRRQVVTARGFDPRIPGSNPGVPAIFFIQSSKWQHTFAIRSNNNHAGIH